MVKYTRTQAMHAVDALAGNAKAQRAIYSGMILLLKDTISMFDSYYDLLFDFYKRTGEMPPPTSCLSGTAVKDWKDFHEYYYGKVWDLVILREDLSATKRWIECYVDLLFLFKTPPAVREDMQRMIWKLYDKRPHDADMVVDQMVKHEELPPYERPPEYVGGRRRRRYTFGF